MSVQNHTNPELQSATEQDCFFFDSFVLDHVSGVLKENGIEIPLRPKSFEVLKYLLRHSGRLVSRKELLEAIWPDVVVTDDSLTQCLIEIRKALGDEKRTIVRTMPRRGYLFDLPVTVAANTKVEPAVANRSRWRRPSLWTLIAVAALATAIGATWLRIGFAPQHPAREPSVVRPPGEVSMAVMPFVDLSEAGDQEYLADGISEEILDLLTQVPGLTVIARTSSFSFRDQGLDIVSIARRLNVSYVLEGSVRNSGDRVRVSAHLVDGGDATKIWSQNYDDRLDDVFTMQRRIARAVTGELESRLLIENRPGAALFEPASDTRNIDAWNLYLRGKYYYNRRSEGDILRAQRDFEQALALDPEMSAAWLGVAGAFKLRWSEKELTGDVQLTMAEALPLIRYSVEKALELAPNNPEALMRLANLNWLDGKMERSKELIYQAMRHGHNNALVQSMLAGIAFSTAGPTTAVELQRRAARLDPVSFLQLGNLAYYLYMNGKPDEAADVFHQAAEINPESRLESKETLALIAIQQGDYAAAEALAKSLPAGSARDQVQGMLYYQAGNYVEANAALDRLKQYDDIPSQLELINVHAFRGETNAVFRSLESFASTLVDSNKVHEDRFWYTQMKASVFLQYLHDNPRWAEWVRKTEEQLRNPLLDELGRALEQYAATDWPEPS